MAEDSSICDLAGDFQDRFHQMYFPERFRNAPGTINPGSILSWEYGQISAQASLFHPKGFYPLLFDIEDLSHIKITNPMR